MGAYLEQKQAGIRKTVAFASRFLKIDELIFSINKVWALDHVKDYLLCQKMYIFTDHKALIGALKDA